MRIKFRQPRFLDWQDRQITLHRLFDTRERDLENYKKSIKKSSWCKGLFCPGREVSRRIAVVLIVEMLNCYSLRVLSTFLGTDALIDWIFGDADYTSSFLLKKKEMWTFCNRSYVFVFVAQFSISRCAHFFPLARIFFFLCCTRLSGRGL